MTQQNKIGIWEIEMLYGYALVKPIKKKANKSRNNFKILMGIF